MAKIANLQKSRSAQRAKRHRRIRKKVQGTAEQQPFDRSELDTMLDLAEAGIRDLVDMQIRATRPE